MYKELADAEKQLLIAALQTAEAQETTNLEKLRQAGAKYFRRYLLDWSEAFPSLIAKGLLREQERVYSLTEEGESQAKEARQERPGMWYWYNDYYIAMRESKAHALFCERLYGMNLCQHGFMDMSQLARLLEVTKLNTLSRVLDIGCGNGMIANGCSSPAHISDLTGAHICGIDNIAEAIRQARERTPHKRDRLIFQEQDLNQLDYPANSFGSALHCYTILSIDTIYFSNDYSETLRRMKAIIRPGGQMAFFYTHAVKSDEPRESLLVDRTPLAEAFHNNALRFEVWDLTQADYRHAQRKKQIVEELKAAFEAEGNLFLYENRIAEAKGHLEKTAEGRMVRYLYRATFG